MSTPRARQLTKGASTKTREFVVNWWQIDRQPGSKLEELAPFRVSGATLPEIERNVRAELQRRKRRVRSLSYTADSRVLVVVFKGLEERPGLDSFGAQQTIATAARQRRAKSTRVAAQARARKCAKPASQPVADQSERPRLRAERVAARRLKAATKFTAHKTRKNNQRREQQAAADELKLAERSREAKVRFAAAAKRSAERGSLKRKIEAEHGKQYLARKKLRETPKVAQAEKA